MPEWVTVHVDVADADTSWHEGAHDKQLQTREFTVRLLCSLSSGRRLVWYFSRTGALLKALGAVDGDTVQLQCKPDGRLVAWRAARPLQKRRAPQRQQQRAPQPQQAAAAVPLAACPADSILVGYRFASRTHPRVGALRALWPRIACQLECGQSAEVEVHAAVAGTGAEALGPFRLTLKLYKGKRTSPSCRLDGGGPLFRAMGAQDGDAIHMWRSPGDRRVMAGAQPRSGVQRGRGKARLGQQQGQAQAREQEQQEQGGRRRQQLHRKAWQSALHPLDSEDSVPVASDGEDGGATEVYSHGDFGQEWEGGGGVEEGQDEVSLGPPGDGLSRPPKRSRAAEEVAPQYGGPSATQQQQMQPATCPVASTHVGFKHRTQLDVGASAVQALWPNLASQWVCGESAEVEVHAAVAGTGGQALSPFRVTLARYSWRTRSIAWRLNGCGPLFRALGAQDGDAVLMWRSPEGGRLIAEVQPRGGVQRGREEQQQREQLQPAACPDGSTFVGRKVKSYLYPRVGAVRALWPKVASQLACGQSTEVEVHVAVKGTGGEVLEPFRVVLTLNKRHGKAPAWRLTGCWPLFRVLRAQQGDAIFMWRSPGDGRLVAGVQPRGGAPGGGRPRCEVRGGGEGVQVGQRGAGPERARGKVRQMYDEHETTDEEDMWLSEGGDDEEWEEWEEAEEASSYGGEASAGAMLDGEGRVGQGCSVLGGVAGQGEEVAGFASGGEYEAGVGEYGEGEEGEETATRRRRRRMNRG